MSTAALIKIILIVLALSISAISWLLKQVADQRKKKEAREAIERREEQMLRTGRSDEDAPTMAASMEPMDATPPLTAPTTHADARRRLQELAERRQRQLEELRRRQSAGGSESPVPPTRPQTARQPAASASAPAAPAAPRAPERASRPRGGASPDPRAANRQAGNRSQAKRQGRPAEPRAKQDASAPARQQSSAERAEAESRSEALEARGATARTGSRRGPQNRMAQVLGMGSAGAGGMTAADWKRAIILREILDRPVGERFRDTPTGPRAF